MIATDTLLWRALVLNATFSTLCAFIMLATSEWIAQQLNLAETFWVILTAGFLFLFALQLWNIVRNRIIRSWEIISIISGDIAWVVVSLVLIAIYHDSMSGVGLVLVDLVALAVLFFAILQIRGLSTFRKTGV